MDDSEPAWSLPEPKQVLVWGGGASEKWTQKVELPCSSDNHILCVSLSCLSMLCLQLLRFPTMFCLLARLPGQILHSLARYHLYNIFPDALF